jgi:hypothetical protein
VVKVARQLKSGDARNEDSQVVLRLKAMSEEAAHLATALASRSNEARSGPQGRLDGHSRAPEEVLKLLIAMRRALLRQFATPLFVNPGWDMLLAVKTMTEGGFRHLLVMEMDEPVGIVSLRDLMDSMAELVAGDA